MKLHPMAVAIVESLIKDGRAGDKPFGLPLRIWEEAIAARNGKIREGTCPST